MRFGYIWRGWDAIPEQDQRRLLLQEAEADGARILTDRQPKRDERDAILSALRPGDAICVVCARYIADDVVELHQILAHCGERDAPLYVVELGREFTGTRAMSELTEDYVDTRRKEQTQAARERLRKLPAGARGGRPPAIDMTPVKRGRFKKLWGDATYSTADMAIEFGCSKATIWRMGKKLKLGPKAV